MKLVQEVKPSTNLKCLQLLLLIICTDRCASLHDSSLPDIFYPFGADEGDSVVNIRRTFAGAINIPYTIFNYRKLYVSRNRLYKIEGRTIELPMLFLRDY